MKKWFVFAVLIIILASVAWFLSSQNSSQSTNNNNNAGSNNVAHKPTVYSSNGTVKQIEGVKYTLTLSDGKTVKTYNIPANVQVVKRVVGKTGTTLQSSMLSAVAVGSEIVVYSSQDTTGSNPLINRVEIVK